MVIPLVTLVFDPTTNDPNRVAQRHVTREFAKGRTADDVVREAWQRGYDPVPDAITTQSWTAPPGTLVHKITYDSASIGGASEAKVMEALTKAGQR
jgi:hypothetical protein